MENDDIYTIIDNINTLNDKNDNDIENEITIFKNNLLKIKTNNTNKIIKEIKKLKEENDKLKEIANRVNYNDNDIHNEYKSKINEYELQIKYKDRVIENLSNQISLFNEKYKNPTNEKISKINNLTNEEKLEKINEIIELSVIMENKMEIFEYLKKDYEKLQDDNDILYSKYRKLKKNK